MSNGVEPEVGQLGCIYEDKVLSRLIIGGFSQAQLSLAEAQRLINEEAQGRKLVSFSGG
jgi:hypothetical protein